MLAEIEAPPAKKFRYGSLVLIVAGLAAAGAGAYVILNDVGRAPKSAAVATATKAPPAPAVSKTQSSGATDGSTPTEPPPPEETQSLAAAIPKPEPESSEQAPVQSAADAISAAPLPSPPPQRVAKVTPQSEPTSFSGGGLDARRKQCIAQCERNDGECRSLGRRGKQDCMKAVAFGANAGRLTTTNPATASCAFFGQSRCDYSLNRDACVARMTTRYKACVEMLGGTVASRRQDCDDAARESDQMCLEELRECRASCE
jgi:hypothetical protein